MATIHLIICDFLIAFLWSNQLYKRHLLKADFQQDKLAASRVRLSEIATNEIGVRERSGQNDGPEVETYLAVVGLKKGNPWCAAFISWVYAEAGFAKPRTAWSPALFPNSRLVKSALPGDVIGIYFPVLKRIAHVGIVMQQKNEWIYSIEGNTTVDGSAEGDGVYRRVRHVRTLHSIANWLPDREVLP